VKHHGKVKAARVKASHKRRGFSKRRRPAAGFRSDLRVKRTRPIGAKIKQPVSMSPRGRVKVRQPRRNVELRQRPHSQPRVQPRPATNPRFRSGGRSKKVPKPSHFGRNRPPAPKAPSMGRMGRPSPRVNRRQAPPVNRVNARPRMNRTRTVKPRRSVAPRRPAATRSPSRVKRSTFKRRAIKPSKQRSSRRSFSKGNRSRSKPARSKSKRGKRR
jgi:hypothetical protein